MNSSRQSETSRRIRVLVVEHDRDLLLLLRQNLEMAGYVVSEAIDAEEAALQLKEQPHDLLLLEWMQSHAAPKSAISGIELLRRLRRRPETRWMPVIVLTARHAEADRVKALETGADDLMLEPFSVTELMARIDALLRRAAPQKVGRVVKAGDTELDRDLMRVRRRGKTLQLGPIDYRLLEFFLEAPGRVHSREAILGAVWGSEAEIHARTIDVHIGRLRRSLLTGWRSNPIKTIRGVGYRFDPK